MLQILAVLIGAAGLYYASKNSNAANQAKNSNLSSGGTPTNTQSGEEQQPVVSTLANLNAGPATATRFGVGVGGTILGKKAPATSSTPSTATAAQVSTKNASGVYQPNPVLNSVNSAFSNAGVSPTNPPFIPEQSAPIFTPPLIVVSNNKAVAPQKLVTSVAGGALASPSQGFTSIVETVGSGPGAVEFVGSPIPVSTTAKFGVSTGITLGKGL